MADKRSIGECLSWSLGSFHAAALLMLVLAFAWMGGGLGRFLAETGSALGIASYTALFLAAWAGTRAALARMVTERPASLRYGVRTLGDSAFGGILAAIGFLAFLILASVVSILVAGADDLETMGERLGAAVLVVVVVLGLFGGAVASGVGAIIGAIAGLIDGATVELAWRLLGLEEASDVSPLRKEEQTQAR